MINTRYSIPLGIYVQEDVEAARLGIVVPRPPSFITAPARLSLSLNSPEQQRLHTTRLSLNSPSLHDRAQEQSHDHNPHAVRAWSPQTLNIANHPDGHHH
jgi:hypothetical protein